MKIGAVTRLNEQHIAVLKLARLLVNQHFQLVVFFGQCADVFVARHATFGKAF